MTVEDTIIIPARLPDGQDWAYHSDLNIVEVSDRLDEAGIMVALCDLQAQWRRNMVRLVPGQRPKRRQAQGHGAPPSYSLFRNSTTAQEPQLRTT